MNISDIIIIGVIAVLFILAVIKRYRDKKNGKGCCNGASCSCCIKENNCKNHTNSKKNK